MNAEQLFKPGYEGHRPSAQLSGPEKQTLRLNRAELVRRLNEAMLCLSVAEGTGNLGIRAGTPTAMREFSDLIGRDRDAAARPRFRPTAAQIDAMDPTLKLLDGLTRTHFKVVFLRALDSFDAQWPWAKIGGFFGMSDRWAESAYDAALVQAARRAGILPMTTAEFAILVCSVWRSAIPVHERGWMSHITTSANPRQETSNLRGKSPLKLEAATALWVAGPPLAKRIVAETKPRFAGRASHGAWYKAPPEDVLDQLIITAREIGAEWQIEDVDGGRG
jgi:hypothetical protein